MGHGGLSWQIYVEVRNARLGWKCQLWIRVAWEVEREIGQGMFSKVHQQFSILINWGAQEVDIYLIVNGMKALNIKQWVEPKIMVIPRAVFWLLSSVKLVVNGFLLSGVPTIWPSQCSFYQIAMASESFCCPWHSSSSSYLCHWYEFFSWITVHSRCAYEFKQ